MCCVSGPRLSSSCRHNSLVARYMFRSTSSSSSTDKPCQRKAARGCSCWSSQGAPRCSYCRKVAKFSPSRLYVRHQHILCKEDPSEQQQIRTTDAESKLIKITEERRSVKLIGAEDDAKSTPWILLCIQRVRNRG